MFVPWIFLDVLGSPLISLGFPCVVLVCYRNIMGPRVLYFDCYLFFSKQNHWCSMVVHDDPWLSLEFHLVFIDLYLAIGN